MTRRYLLIFVAILSGCGRTPEDLNRLLPREVPGGWTLAESQPAHAANLPGDVAGMDWKASVSATYRGPQNINVLLTQFNTDASAFELMQRWRQSEGIAFHKGPYFVICRARGNDFTQVSQFARAFQGAFSPQR